MQEAFIQSDNTKTPPKSSIAQRSWNNSGRSVRVMTVTQLVWITRFTESQPSHLLQNLCNQRDTHLKICNM